MARIDAESLDFAFMADVPVGPTKAELQQNVLDAWKAKWGVHTNHWPDQKFQPWDACLETSRQKHIRGDSALLYAEGGSELQACINLATMLGMELPREL